MSCARPQRMSVFFRAQDRVTLRRSALLGAMDFALAAGRVYSSATEDRRLEGLAMALQRPLDMFADQGRGGVAALLQHRDNVG